MQEVLILILLLLALKTESTPQVSSAIESNILTVSGANLHLCSSLFDYCANIKEFTIRNEPYKIKANNKPCVRIDFKMKFSANDKEESKSFGYLYTYGALSTEETAETDTRRTKM